MLKKLFCALCALCLLTSAAAAEQTIHMTFTGDVTLGSEKAYRTYKNSFHTVAETEGYEYFFRDWVELFSADDLTVVNLEGPLTDSDSQEDKSKTFRFNGKTDFVNILTLASIEACNISNNHCSADFGKQGFQSTKDTLTAAGIGWFAVEDVWIWEKDGIKIAFFGFNSTKLTSKMISWVKTEIPRLKSEEGVNAVVFVYHGGSEYAKKHNQKQTEAAHMAIDAGADLVIMHHPHVVQGVEVYNNRIICYSLGNFCFGGNRSIKHDAIETAVAGVTMDFDDNGVFTGSQLTLWPGHISTDSKANTFQPIHVTGEEAEAVMTLIQNDTKFTLNPVDEATGCAVQDYVPAE